MISVIVPVYNAESYLAECIDSVLKQTYSDFELILVNDGSIDDSLKICKSYEDKRIIVIDQANAGVSSARNAGIEQSKGEYICFVDSDDTLPNDSLYTLYNEVITSRTDAVIAPFQYQYGNTYLPHALRQKVGVYSYRDVLSDFIDDGTLSGFYIGSVCSALYKKSLIDSNGIHFVEGLKNNEDGLFNFEYALAASNFSVIDSVAYNYRQDQSIGKPSRFNENFGDKVFSYLENKQWNKSIYDYDIQKARRYVTLLWWDIYHFLPNASFLEGYKFIHQGLLRQNVSKGFHFMNVKRMNFYKKIIFYLMRYKMIFLLLCTVKYFIPLLKTRLSR